MYKNRHSRTFSTSEVRHVSVATIPTVLSRVAKRFGRVSDSRKWLLRFLATLFFILNYLICISQKIYKKNSTYSNDIIFRIQNYSLYKGPYVNSSNLLASFVLNKSFKGVTYSSNSILFMEVGNKIYKGNSTYSEDIVYTISNNKIYKGNSTYSEDVLYTISNNKIYKGNSTYSEDIILSFSEEISNIQIITILYYL